MSNTSGEAGRSDALVLFGVTGTRGGLNVPVVGVTASRWSPAQLRKRAGDATQRCLGGMAG